jgi:hypothetical protein
MQKKNIRNLNVNDSNLHGRVIAARPASPPPRDIHSTCVFPLKPHHHHQVRWRGDGREFWLHTPYCFTTEKRFVNPA